MPSHSQNSLFCILKKTIIRQIAIFFMDLARYMGFLSYFSNTRKAVHLTMVTTYGVRQNSHAGIVQSEVTLEDLFAS